MNNSSRIRRGANHSSDQPTSVFAPSVTSALAIKFLKLGALEKFVLFSPPFAFPVVLLNQRYTFGKKTICSSIAISLSNQKPGPANTCLEPGLNDGNITILLSDALFLVLSELLDIVHDFLIGGCIIFLFLIQALPVFALSSLSSSTVEVVVKWFREADKVVLSLAVRQALLVISFKNVLNSLLTLYPCEMAREIVGLCLCPECLDCLESSCPFDTRITRPSYHRR